MPDPRLMQQQAQGAAAPASSPFYTDQQWLQLLQLGDLDAQEKQIAQQRAMAQQLRGARDSGRMDWGSQAGRGLEGIGAALYDYAGRKDEKQFRADKQKWLNTVAEMYRQQQQPAAAPSPAASAPSGFEDY